MVPLLALTRCHGVTPSNQRTDYSQKRGTGGGLAQCFHGDKRETPGQGTTLDLREDERRQMQPQLGSSVARCSDRSGQTVSAFQWRAVHFRPSIVQRPNQPIPQNIIILILL